MLAVYDYRKDVRNVLVTPEIRARFFRLEPGTVARMHTHDLGHEVFLMLQGKAIFEIAGESAELGPGQMCVALKDEPHSIRVTSAEPVIMYLSVTPHIQPTHTMWTEDGKRLPHRFVQSSNYDAKTDTETPVNQLVDRHIAATQAAADTAQKALKVQKDESAKLKKALASGDLEAASKARSNMWDAMFEMFEQVYKLADGWNTLAPRTGKVN